MKNGVMLLLLSIAFLLASCSGNEASGSKLDYDQTKKMIVDILKTDEGKKAIQDILTNKEVKQQLIMDQAVVTDTIETTLTSEKGEEFWKKAFKDPKFAEAIAKSMKQQNEEMLKDLMKDPEYQGMMMDILKDPQLQKDMAQALKSQEFREYLQEVVSDTFESPLYKVKVEEMLLKAAEEMGTEKKKDKKEASGGKDQQEGEQKQ